MYDTNIVFKSFELIPDKKSGAYLYTPEISAYVKNSQLINLLNEIKFNSLFELNETTLNNLIKKYDLPGSVVKEYFANDLKIMTTLGQQRFENLMIDIADTEIKNKLNQNLSNKYGLKVLSKVDSTAINNKTLIVSFSHYYQENKFKEIYQLAESYNAWVITAYIANNYLVIDNIYNKLKGVPCHFCNIYRHQNVVGSSNSLRQTSWINFCRRLVTENIETLPTMNLTDIERGLVTFWLAKTIKSFVNPLGSSMLLNDLTKYQWINLITGEANQEQSVHWAYCNCVN